MTIVLVILALLAAALGFALSSQATTGVAIICGACLLGILARIAQAAGQSDELVRIRMALERMSPPPE